jgi:magnesium-transporting ATPase (P-type)
LDKAAKEEKNDSPAVLTVVEVYRTFSMGSSGLTQAEAEIRFRKLGPNVIREVRGKSLFVKFISNFTHLMAILLWVGGAVGFLARMPELGIAIWMVNVINGVFSFWQEYRAEKATEALKKLLPSYARVLREGEERRILAEELVTGDVMLLSEGDRISADGRLVEVSELRVDQSTLTGESHPIRKICDGVFLPGLANSEMPNLVFAGTSVTSGTGKAVVFATGMATEFGRIAEMTQLVDEDLSPLQKEMGFATRMVTVIACSIGIIFFVLAAVLVGVSLAESFIFAMGMVVAFVPEGMLPLVTLSLARSTQRMARRNALIKRLSAVETLGCTTVICTDKTGTLTQNEMTVRDLWIAGCGLTVSGAGYKPEGMILENGMPATVDEDLRVLLIAGGLCNNSSVIPPNAGTPYWTVLGDRTEAAMKVAALKGGVDLDAELKRAPRIRELPFDSQRKRMCTIHQIASIRMAYVKGAPKEILGLCSHVRWNKRDRIMDDDLRSQIMAAHDTYARNGLRVLAVALRELQGDGTDYQPEGIERDLTFLGLEAMMDPPRDEVAQAVETCHRAGIRIIMITGDYGLTAESIARRIGILTQPQPRIINGTELDAMDDETLKTILSGEVIFARVTPEHKLRIVISLQEIGNVVAVTGDGVNDAPALKKADIGVAMGIAGTDVANEAADIILMDDNFASIVNAIEEGRGVYANIKKFVCYIFTSNTPEAVPFIFWALSRGRIPLALNVMEILAIDLGTDMMPALALGDEIPEPGLMDRPPRNLGEHVITRPLLLRAYLFLGLIQSLAAMTAFYFQYWVNGYWGQWLDLPPTGIIYESATAMTLGAVVATQIGNLFAQRTERTSVFTVGWFTNRMIWIGIASELVLISLIVYVPFFQEVFGTAAFPLQNWLFLFAWTPSLLIADELRKAHVRRRDRTMDKVSKPGGTV